MGSGHGGTKSVARQGGLAVSRDPVEYAGLTREERYAIDAYSNDNRGYHNNLLRGQDIGEVPDFVGGPHGLRGNIKLIDSALAKGRLASDTTLYRGTNFHAFGLDSAPKRGATITDRGFNSASLDKRTAEGFGRQVFMTIRAKKGTPAIDVSRISGGLEREVLLGRGTKYRVVNVKTVGNRTYITARVK